MVQGHWGDDGSQGSIRSWNFEVQRGVGISRLLPFRPMASLLAQAERGTPCTGHSASLCLGVGKLYGVEVGLVSPEGPQGFEDFALGVQPGMSGGTMEAERSLIKVPDRALFAFGRLEEGAIGDGLEEGMALAIELFKAQGFAVAGLVADGQPAVTGQGREVFEAGWVLDQGDKEVGADDPDAGDGAKVSDFGEGAAGLEHEAAGLMLGDEGLVHQIIEELGLRSERRVGQLVQPELAAGLGKDGGAGGEQAPMLEEGFDFEFEPGLAADGVIVSQGGAFEEDAEFVGGLPNRFEFA